jgi:TPP-dependent pyruvate/acetoin dehydrogenase alpha subunit
LQKKALNALLRKVNSDSIFRTALLIRRVEERVAELYPSDLIQSPVHLSLGQEHHVAALVAALDPRDALFSSYRSHASYLAKGGSLEAFFAELFGKCTGMSGGKAGSMHINCPEKRMLGSSGIVGAVLPHAVGYAYGFKLRNEALISVSITGDGSVEEGVFFESLNFASLRNAPVLFVIEQNDWAVYTRRKQRQRFDLQKVVEAFKIPYYSLNDGFDFENVFNQSVLARKSILTRSGPAVMEITTCRYREHVGIGLTNDSWSNQERESWMARDPLIHDPRRQRYIQEIDLAIEAAVKFAQNSPTPEASMLLKNVIQ